MLAHARPALSHPTLHALCARLMLGHDARIADATGAAPPRTAEALEAWIDADGLLRLADDAYRRALLNAAPAWAILGGMNAPPVEAVLPGYRALERHGVLEAGGVRRFLILQRLA